MDFMNFMNHFHDSKDDSDNNNEDNATEGGSRGLSVEVILRRLSFRYYGGSPGDKGFSGAFGLSKRVEHHRG